MAPLGITFSQCRQCMLVVKDVYLAQIVVHEDLPSPRYQKLDPSTTDTVCMKGAWKKPPAMTTPTKLDGMKMDMLGLAKISQMPSQMDPTRNTHARLYIYTMFEEVDIPFLGRCDDEAPRGVLTKASQAQTEEELARVAQVSSSLAHHERDQHSQQKSIGELMESEVAVTDECQKTPEDHGHEADDLEIVT